MNLTVTDVQMAIKFFEKYFGLRSMEGTTDDAEFIGMLDPDGFVLTLMQNKVSQKLSYPDSFHIGFLQQGELRTNEIYQQLVQDGFEVKPPGFYHGKELYVNTPFGITIQVS